LSASGINGNGAGIDGKSQATKKVLGNRSESGKKINKKRRLILHAINVIFITAEISKTP
jgi:hypothetical protein